MLNKNNQSIKDGNQNVQVAGDLTINAEINLFTDHQPQKIVFYEDDICNVIEEFDRFTDLFDENDTEIKDKEFDFVLKPEKNVLNNLSPSYFETICEDFLPYFYKVKTFLELPQNKQLLKKYRKSAFQLKVHISVIRKEFRYFEDVLNHIIHEIISKSSHDNIRENPDLMIVFVNFMYWNCDIGKRV